MPWNKCVLALLFFTFTLFAKAEEGHVFSIDDSGLIVQLIKEAEAETDYQTRIGKARDAYLTAKSVAFERGMVWGLKLLIDAHLTQHENIEALRYCFSILPLLEKLKSPELSKYYEITGDIYTLESIYKKAIEYYEKAGWIDGKLIESRGCKIVNNALIDQNYAKAVEYLNLLKVQVKTAEIYEQLGFCLQKLKQYPEAIANYNKALELQPNNTALVQNNLGYIEFNNQNYKQAIEHFKAAEAASDSRAEKLNALTNLSISFQRNGDFNSAVSTMQECISLAQKDRTEDKYQQMLADIYLNNGDAYSALTYSNLALRSFNRNPKIMASAYLTKAQAFQKIYDFEGALSNYKIYLTLNDSILLREIAAQQSLTQKSADLQKMEKELRETLLNDQIKFLNIQQLQLESEKLKLNSEKLMLEAAKRDAEIITLKREQEVKEARLQNIALENDKNRQKLALAAQEILNNNIKNKLEVLKQQEEKQRLQLINKEAQEKQRLQQISLLERDKKISLLQAEKQKDFKRNTLVAGLVAVLLLVSAGIGIFWIRKKNKILAKQNIDIENKNKQIEQSHVIIEAEKLKSDGLLLNILPEEIAHELKERGAAKPIHYDMVSILFTDFVSFTQYSERVSNEKLIEDLNTIFQSFDEIIDEFNLEKIKTIGDSYMCAGGLPVPNTTNPLDAANAAIKMRNYIEEFNKNRPEEDQLKIRIGINTGPCVAGVVGKRKFAYDIWGDSVNTAARMEQSGEAGRINISENTYELIKDHFHCEYRGMVKAKNKGEIKMYFAEAGNRAAHG